MAHLAHADVSELVPLLCDRRHFGVYRRRISRAAHPRDLRISLAPRRPQLTQGVHGPSTGLRGRGLVETDLEVAARSPSTTLAPKLGRLQLGRIVADEVAARTRRDAQPRGAMGTPRAPIWLELHDLAAAQIVHLPGEIAHRQREGQRLMQLLESAAAGQ